MNSTENILFLRSYNHNNETTKYQSIYTFLKTGIQTLHLKGNLPSVRVLADIFDVNKNTIIKVLEELVWEELLIVYPRKGYTCNENFVSLQAAQQTIPRKKLPIVFPLSQNKHIVYNKELNYKTVLENSRKDKQILQYISKQTFTYNDAKYKCLQSFAYTFDYSVAVDQLLLCEQIFLVKFYLLRTILNDDTQIIISRSAIEKWPLEELNMNLKVINFPKIDEKLTQHIELKFKENDAVRCIFLPDFAFSNQQLMNILTLCYKYGVLCVQEISANNTQITTKQHYAKSLDYSNYVIHIDSRNPQFNILIADATIIASVEKHTIQLLDLQKLAQNLLTHK